MRVEMPLRFPNEADTIYRQAQEFRKLSSSERILAILDLMASGAQLMDDASKREYAKQWRQAHEEQWRQAHRKLFADHGY